MKVLGIDIGTAITGWSVISKDNIGTLKVQGFGIIKTLPTTETGQRLAEIYDGVEELINSFGPNEMAIEDLFYFKNQKTVIKVSQARGVCILAAIKKGLSVYDYTPLQVKQAVTGYGRAEKSQVQAMVTKLLNLTEVPKQDDAADALAIAYCHINSLKL